MFRIRTTFAALCLSLLLSVGSFAAAVTYPGPPATDTSGVAVTSGVAAAIVSVTDLDNNAIASPGAVAHIAGGNPSVVYDAAAHGEAWVTYSLTASGHTFANQTIFCSADPQTLASTYASSTANGTTLTSTGVKVASTQSFNNAGQTSLIPANTTQWGGSAVGGMPNSGAVGVSGTVSLSSGDETKIATIGNDTSGVTTLLGRIPGTVTAQSGDAYALLASLLNVGHTAYTSAALANAPAGGSGGATAGQIASAVWEEPTANHTTVGTFGPVVTGLPAATLAAIKADALFVAALKRGQGRYTYNETTHVFQPEFNDGTPDGSPITLTVATDGVITAR